MFIRSLITLKKVKHLKISSDKKENIVEEKQEEDPEALEHVKDAEPAQILD